MTLAEFLSWHLARTWPVLLAVCVVAGFALQALLEHVAFGHELQRRDAQLSAFEQFTRRMRQHVASAMGVPSEYLAPPPLAPRIRCGCCARPFTSPVRVSVQLATRTTTRGEVLERAYEEWCGGCASLCPSRVDHVAGRAEPGITGGHYNQGGDR